MRAPPLKSRRVARKARKAPAKKSKARAGLPRRKLSPKMQLVQDVGIGGQTQSSHQYPYNRGSEMVRAICNVGQKQRALYNQVNDLTAFQGTQNFTVYSHAHQSILKRYADSYQNTPAARGQAGVGQLSDSVVRYVLQSIRVNHAISNQTNAPCLLKIYDIECRRDTQNIMDYTSPNGNVFNWLGGPGSAWDAGLNAATDTVIPPAIPYSSQYGVVPTASALFNKFFKISKQTSIELATGAVHRASWNRTYNRLMDASVYGMTDGYGIQGVTTFQLFVLAGSPATLLSSATTDVGDTSGLAKVSIITDTEAVYTFGSAYGQTLYLDNPVANDIPLGSVAGTVTVGSPLVDRIVTA